MKGSDIMPTFEEIVEAKDAVSLGYSSCSEDDYDYSSDCGPWSACCGDN